MQEKFALKARVLEISLSNRRWLLPRPSRAIGTDAPVSTSTAPEVERVPLPSGGEAVISSKQCTRCKQVKDLNLFIRHGRSKDGWTRFCRVCTHQDALEHPPEGENVQFRTCRECGEVKNADQFTKNLASPAGLDRKCRACTLLVTRARQQRQKAKVLKNGGPLAPSKACSLCGEDKPAAQFYRSYATKVGLSSRCRECTTAVLRGVDAEDIRKGVVVHAKKSCKQCHSSLPLRSFAKDKDSPDGRHSLCKTCARS